MTSKWVSLLANAQGFDPTIVKQLQVACYADRGSLEVHNAMHVNMTSGAYTW